MADEHAPQQSGPHAGMSCTGRLPAARNLSLVVSFVRHRPPGPLGPASAAPAHSKRTSACAILGGQIRLPQSNVSRIWCPCFQSAAPASGSPTIVSGCCRRLPSKELPPRSLSNSGLAAVLRLGATRLAFAVGLAAADDAHFVTAACTPRSRRWRVALRPSLRSRTWDESIWGCTARVRVFVTRSIVHSCCRTAVFGEPPHRCTAARHLLPAAFSSPAARKAAVAHDVARLICLHEKRPETDLRMDTGLMVGAAPSEWRDRAQHGCCASPCQSRHESLASTPVDMLGPPAVSYPCAAPHRGLPVRPFLQTASRRQHVIRERVRAAQKRLPGGLLPHCPGAADAQQHQRRSTRARCTPAAGGGSTSIAAAAQCQRLDRAAACRACGGRAGGNVAAGGSNRKADPPPGAAAIAQIVGRHAAGDAPALTLPGGRRPCGGSASTICQRLAHAGHCGCS